MSEAVPVPQEINALAKRLCGRTAVRGMLEKALGRGELKMPTLDGIKALAAMMIMFQIAHFIHPLANKHKKVIKEAENSLKKFISALDNIEEARGEFGPSTDRFTEFSRERSASLTNMKDTANTWLSDPFFRVLAVTLPPLEKWRTYAPDLAILFKQVVEEANPGQVVGMSADGPCSAFLSQAVKAMFDEVVTPANISGWLYEKIPQETRNSFSGARKPN